MTDAEETKFSASLEFILKRANAPEGARHILALLFPKSREGCEDLCSL